MSYRTDSDIYVPYGRIIKKQSKGTNGSVIAIRDEPRSPISKTTISNFNLSHKTKSIAWFVSDCSTWSRREYLASALSKYIDVDVYGYCGTHECREYGDGCYRMVEQKYKFYLSFENSLCRDYVTEKLFNLLQYSIIPVVYGDSQYYRSMLPPKSYIDARNFTTVRELASFLSQVGNDDQLYRSYFDWKHYYESITEIDTFCELAKALDAGIDSNRTKGLDSWWVFGARCQRGSYFLK